MSVNVLGRTGAPVSPPMELGGLQEHRSRDRAPSFRAAAALISCASLGEGEHMANLHSLLLFPTLPCAPASPLAQRAAAAPLTDTGHDVEFRLLEARSILNRSVSLRRLSMAWSINPYRGCEFGCRYCYARYTHEFLAPSPGSDDAAASASKRRLTDPESFERVIFYKQNAAWLLQQELPRIDPAGEIAIGTATDPYQPIERRKRVTRSLLEVFARRSGYRIGIVTKSPLIVRDLDLLTTIARQNTLVVHLTITTTDASLARLLEPRAPRPDLRFAAVRRLRGAGIRTGVLSSPLLPGLTDTEDSLDRTARMARAADASFLAGEPLFLKPCSRPTYLRFLAEHFPHLEEDCRRRFEHADFVDRSYREKMAALVARVCARHRIPPRSTDALLTRDVGAHARRTPASSPPAPLTGRLFA